MIYLEACKGNNKIVQQEGYSKINVRKPIALNNKLKIVTKVKIEVINLET